MIQCKRVYEQASPDDGYRILVDRLKKTELAYDEWCKALAPSTELRKAFHSDTIDFTAFSQAYREELAQQADEGARLATLARRQTVTLLFAAKNTEQNHALVLADWLRHL